MHNSFILLILFGSWFEAALGLFPPRAQVPKLGLTEEEAASLADPAVAVSGNSTFTQLIDHENPAVGTFSQTYWYNTTYWTPGSPVCKLNLTYYLNCATKDFVRLSFSHLVKKRLHLIRAT
jgi:hypothetical protein